MNMKIKIAPFAFIIFFALFLVLGMETGQSLFAKGQGSTIISGTDSLAEEGADQVSKAAPFVLLIQVDDMQKTSPFLEGVWLMGYGSQTDPLLFFPLLPSQASDGQARDQALRESFYFADDGQPSSAFFNLLVERNLDWSGYLVMDRTALAAAVNALEKGELEGGALDAATISGWGPSTQDREGARVAQSDFILDVCEGVSALDSKGDLLPIFDVFADHLFLEGMSAADLSQLWGPITPGGSLRCQFPTLSD